MPVKSGLALHPSRPVPPLHLRGNSSGVVLDLSIAARARPVVLPSLRAPAGYAGITTDRLNIGSLPSVREMLFIDNSESALCCLDCSSAHRFYPPPLPPPLSLVISAIPAESSLSEIPNAGALSNFDASGPLIEIVASNEAPAP